MLSRVGDLELDLVSREVSRCGRKIDLLPREFKLLVCFRLISGVLDSTCCDFVVIRLVGVLKGFVRPVLASAPNE